MADFAFQIIKSNIFRSRSIKLTFLHFPTTIRSLFRKKTASQKPYEAILL